MSGSINKVILVGHLGADPDVRHLASGDPVVNLRLATSQSWQDKQSGERREKTEWHSVVIFNVNIARVAEQYLKKGMQIYLEGALQTRKWQDQSGNERYTTEIVLQKFRGELQMLDPKRNGDDKASSGRSFERQPGKSTASGASPDTPKGKTPSYAEQSAGTSYDNDRFDTDFSSRNFDRDLDDDIPF